MLIFHWRQGADFFNEKKYWHAHEAWEQGWKTLPPLQKLHVQAMIQVAAVFHLLNLGRQRPAVSLARSVIEKLESVERQGGLAPTEARIVIPGAEGAMLSLLEALEKGESWQEIASGLRAQVQFGGDSSPGSC